LDKGSGQIGTKSITGWVASLAGQDNRLAIVSCRVGTTGFRLDPSMTWRPKTTFFSVRMSSTSMWTADGMSTWREKGDDV
jgi:hypothetical protein